MMIVNPYAVLDVFVALLRLPLSVTLIVLGVLAWRHWRRAGTPEERAGLENHCYLLLTLAVVLQWLNVLSWPLFYLLLQSYVPEWPGVMCIYGVMQIGTGSGGPSQYLPALLWHLQALKPALVFLSGAWFALYLVHRSSRTGPLLGRIILLLVLLGIVALFDAAAELTYLLIPKKEVFPSAGCCTELFAHRRELASGPLISDAQRVLLTSAFVVVHAVQMAILVAAARASGRWRSVFTVIALALAGVALAVGGRFLADVATPWLLQLPEHACPYDLLPLAPLAVAAVGLHFLGGFATGWASIVHWLGFHPEVAPTAPAQVRSWLRLALIAYVLSVATMVMELWFA